jgi:hypothetical protein
MRRVCVCAKETAMEMIGTSPAMIRGIVTGKFFFLWKSCYCLECKPPFIGEWKIS